MSITIEDYKNKIKEEFNFSECYDIDDNLQRSFNPGTILLTPGGRQKHRAWLKKAFDEWQRGGRTILLLTPFRTDCKYFLTHLSSVAEIRVLKTSIRYKDHLVTKPMVLAIYKALPLMERNHLVTFN
jgi:hypothetical protein